MEQGDRDQRGRLEEAQLVLAGERDGGVYLTELGPRETGACCLEVRAIPLDRSR